nr:AraC family transcriptional regulator [Hungatella effluvii]
MNKAKELFEQKNASCKEVAAMVGYEDYAQFSRMFKKYTGIPPVEYARKGRESHEHI